MQVLEHHKRWVLAQLEELEHYDSKRPKGHVYEFHMHSQRVAAHIREFAKKFDYPSDMIEAFFWATLSHDIGKIDLPVDIWDLPNKPTEDQRAMRRTHTSLGVERVKKAFPDTYENDLFLRLMIDIMDNHHETIDGSGFYGKTGADLSQEVQMVCICDAFDGWSIKRPHFKSRDITPAGVIKRMKTEKSGQFNPDFLNIFKEIVLKT